MARDEFNSVSVTNETESFSSLEYSTVQSSETTFYNDNKVAVKDEYNDVKVVNNENTNEEKKEERKQSEDNSLDEEELNELQNNGGESSSVSSSSSSASSASSSVSTAASGVAATAATVGAVVIAVPSIIAIVFTTAITDFKFTPTTNAISYNIDLEVEEKDNREFSIFIKNDNDEEYDAQLLVAGLNEGDFTNLESNTDYDIRVIAYTVNVNSDANNPTDGKVKNAHETYKVASLPEGEVLLMDRVKTKVSTNYDSISVKALPDKTSYNIFDTLDIKGLVVEGSNDDHSQVISNNDLTFSKTEFDEAGTQTINVSYNDLSTSFEVDVSYHVIFSFDGTADFKTREITFNLDKIDQIDSVSSVYISTAVGNLPLEVKEGAQTLTLPRGFDFTQTYELSYCYKLTGRDDPIVAKTESVTLRDSHVYLSEVYSFTLDSAIDYYDGTGSAQYSGTHFTNYTLDYVDDFGVFSNFGFTLTGEVDGRTCIYSYTLMGNNPAKEGVRDLVSNATTVEGTPPSYSLLIGRTFSVELTYQDSRETSGDSQTKTIDCGEVTFVKESTTKSTVSVPSTYEVDDTYTYITLGISLEGFDIDNNYCSMSLTLMNQNDGYVQSESIDVVSLSDSYRFRFYSSDIAQQSINLEDVRINAAMYYRAYDVSVYSADASFREGNTVYSETTLIKPNADFDNQTIEVVLDYDDSLNRFDNFNLILKYDDPTGGTTHTHTYPLTKQKNAQSVNLSDGEGDTMEINRNSFEFDYDITYEVDGNVAYAKQDAKVSLTTIDLLIDGYYDSVNKMISATIANNMANVVNITSYPNSMYYVTLENTTDSDQKYTWSFTPDESAGSQQAMLDISEAETETSTEWRVGGSTFEYKLEVYQRVTGDYSNYEMVEYVTGTISFDAYPQYEYTHVGNLFKGVEPTGGDPKYFLPVDIDVNDPRHVISDVTVAFAMDDKDYDTPVDSNISTWSTDIYNVQQVYQVIAQQSYVVNGWQMLEITDLFNQIYVADSSQISLEGQVSDGDTIKYSIYLNAGTNQALAISTGALDVDFSSDDEVLGAVYIPDSLMSQTGEFNINIAYRNNQDSIDGFDYISLEGGDETYYIPITYRSIDGKNIAVSLENAYLIEPTTYGDTSEMGSPIGSAAAVTLAEKLTQGDEYYFNVYYHLRNTTEILHTSFYNPFHFTY